MSGLLTRIRRRRAAAPPPVPAPPDASPATPSAPPTSPTPAASVVVEPAPTTAASSPQERFERPGFRARGQLRRRLRYLRRLRELGLRDVGGLVFDLDRFGRTREDLVREKLDALSAIDAELSSLATALDDDASFDELREIGIAGCPACGALLASESRFCSACGARVDRGDAAIATAFAVGGTTPGEPTSSDEAA